MEKVLFNVNGVMRDGLGRVNGEDPKAETQSAVDRIKSLEAELASLRVPAPPVETVSDTLGDDFPGKTALTEAGYTTRSQLIALSEDALKAVKGVGPATLEQIKTALA